MKIIWLTQGQFTIVDDEDYPRLSKFKWYAQKIRQTYYAVRQPPNRNKILMHREVLFLSGKNLFPDHIDSNGLNNQKYNLRAVTKSQNQWNSRSLSKRFSSKYKGVCINRYGKKWQAHIQKAGVQKYLGVFVSEKDAAIAYNNAAKELHGEFANLNLV